MIGMIARTLLLLVVVVGCRRDAVTHPRHDDSKTEAAAIAAFADRTYDRARALDYRTPMDWHLRRDLRSKAINLYVRACRLGDLRSCWRAFSTDSYHNDRRHEMASRVAEHCLSHDELSCAAISTSEFRNYLANRDDAHAAASRFCERGLGPACFVAAGVHDNPPRPDMRAWLERGCDLGDTKSCDQLYTFASREERGEDELVARRVRMLQRAIAGCERGLWEDCDAMWIWAKDTMWATIPKMVKFAERACRLGMLEACRWVGDGRNRKTSSVDLVVLAQEALCSSLGSCDELITLHSHA